MVFAVSFLSTLRVIAHLVNPYSGIEDVHRIVEGEPARVVAAEAPENLRIVTWNIAYGGQFEEVVAALRALDADVYLLQEVDMFCRRSGWRNVARELAAALDMNWVFGAEFHEIIQGRAGVPALTGQVVLSRYPIEEARIVPFAAQARFRWRYNPVQPRRGGRMALRVRSAGLLLYNAHLESGRSERLRRRQLEAILADQQRAKRPREPVVVAGDFNNRPSMRSALVDRLGAADFEDAVAGEPETRATHVRHRHPIDWIFLHNARVVDAGVSDAQAASDHHPVVATLLVSE